MLGFNDTSTLEGHFVSSPREREKRDRRESRGDEREGQGRKRNRKESEETEEIKTFPSTLTHYKDSRPCPTVSQYQLDAPVMKDTQHLCTTRPPPDPDISRKFRKTYLRTCAPSEDSDQPAHSRSVIIIFAGRILERQGCKFSSCRQIRLIRMRDCAGWFGYTLGTNVRGYVFLNFFFKRQAKFTADDILFFVFIFQIKISPDFSWESFARQREDLFSLKN